MTFFSFFFLEIRKKIPPVSQNSPLRVKKEIQTQLENHHILR